MMVTAEEAKARWETLKSLAVLLAGIAAISGVILTVAHFFPAQTQPPIIIQLPPQAPAK